MSSELVGIAHGQILIQPPQFVGLGSASGTVNTPRGPIEVSWQNTGTPLCGMSSELVELELSCASIGSSGTMAIDFAGYGTPRGICGSFGNDNICQSDGAMEMVSNLCNGKSSCIIPPGADFFNDPCPYTFKRLFVQAWCDNMPASRFSINASIPVGSIANITVPRVDLSNVVVTERNGVVWNEGSFVPGVDGVLSAYQVANEIIFQVGSGDYTFSTSGTNGTTVCLIQHEYHTFEVSCPTGTVFSYIRYASFGTPTGECGSFETSSCNSGLSFKVMEELCLFKQSCSLFPEETIFGDPCPGSFKTLAFEAVCTST